MYSILTIVMPPNFLQILLKFISLFFSFIYRVFRNGFKIFQIYTNLYIKKTNGKTKIDFCKKQKKKSKEDKFNMGQCLILIILVKYYLKFKENVLFVSVFRFFSFY